MVTTSQVIKTLGDTSEARTVARWLAAAEVIPKSKAGRGGAGRSVLSPRDVAMIVLGMASPVARRAPEYVTTVAQMISSDGRKLVDVIEKEIEVRDHFKIFCVMLPCYEDTGGHYNATVEMLDDEGLKIETFSRIPRPPEELGLEAVGDFEGVGKVDTTPMLGRWMRIDRSLLASLNELFEDDE